MKISEIVVEDVIRYLRLDGTDCDYAHLHAAMDAAKHYISAYTGIPESGDGETLDDHEDFYLAFMALCQDAYDNRAYVSDDNFGVNCVVESVLGMHARNLL